MNYLYNPSTLCDLLYDKRDIKMSEFVPLLDNDYRVGWLRPQFSSKLLTFKDVFVLGDQAVHIKDNFGSTKQKSEAINAAVWALRQQPEFGIWNDEYGDVYDQRGNFCFILARCAVVPFGIVSRGSHLNGFIRNGTQTKYWISKRGKNNDGFDGQLDTIAGGYIATCSSPEKTMKTEAIEEAQINEHTLKRMTKSSIVYGIKELPQGLVSYKIHVFNLCLQSSFTPHCLNSEVDSFELLEPEIILKKLMAGKFKFNAVPVIVDWLISQKLVNQKNSSYDQLEALLYQEPDIFLYDKQYQN